jgi:hypothetical protein
MKWYHRLWYNAILRRPLRYPRPPVSKSCIVECTVPHAKKQKHTTGGIPRWSPTLVLVARFSAYVWQSGRDAQFSLTYGRMYKSFLSTDYVRESIA